MFTTYIWAHFISIGEFENKAKLTAFVVIPMIQEYTSNDFSAGVKNVARFSIPSNSSINSVDISCII